MIDESCFADVSANESLCDVSMAPVLPLDARSHDPNSKTSKVKLSKSPGSSFRSKSSGVCHVGSENVSPNQIFSHVALEKPNERNFPAVHAKTQKLSNGSICMTIKLPSATHPGQKQDVDLTAGVDQERSNPESIHLSATSLHNREQKTSVTEIDESSLNYNSDEESLAGHSSAENYSSNSRSSTPINKPSKVITNKPPPNFKRVLSSIRSAKLRGPQHLISNEMRQDLGDEFEPSPEELRSLQVPKQQGAAGHRKTSSGLSSVLFGVFNSVASAGSSSSVKSGHQKPPLPPSRWSKLSHRSSTLSDAPNHTSRANDRGLASASHKATIDRALQRRRILGEFVSSETGYISDLNILAHVCFQDVLHYSISLHQSRCILPCLVPPS